MNITFHIDEAYIDLINPEPIRQALLTTARLTTQEATPAQHLTVVVTDNQTVQQLNHQFRGLDTPTDVLAFESKLTADFPVGDPTIAAELGDLIIAYPVAAAQATVAGHSAPAEITLLAVHGLLHLLGFDHDTPTDQEKMWAVQQQIMTALGLAHVQPSQE